MSANIDLLKSFLNYSSDKIKIISQNIANINAPNYKRRDIDFKSYLENHLLGEIKTTGNKQIQLNELIPGESENTEGNNITMEEEMSELAKNTLNFKFAAKQTGNYYKNLQSVIKSGG